MGTSRPAEADRRGPRAPHPRVLIAGGGVGAVEAALALRDLAGDAVGIELIAPHDVLVYRPLTVGEPFGYAAGAQLPLARLERTHNVHYRADALVGIDPERREVTLQEAGRRSFDALIVAVGARPREWLPGSLTFRGAPDVAAYESLLKELEWGGVTSVLFAAAPGHGWTLPLYELALLTAAWAAERGVSELALRLTTPEVEPLAVFGPAAARAVHELLSDRGIKLLADRHPTSIAGRRVELNDGRSLEADHVVTLPELVGNPVPGLPTDQEGFVPVDEHCAVIGLADVYAVGDATAQPIKQGGLATQQADAAAAAIAAALGSPVVPAPYEPVVRGLLLSGVASAYLRAGLTGEESDDSARTGDASGSVASYAPLWWPPSKIAGRYLAPFLAEEPSLAGAPQLSERSALGPGRSSPGPDEVGQMAQVFAEMDARTGDHRSALRWLHTLETVQGVLRPDQARLRREWEREAEQHA